MAGFFSVVTTTALSVTVTVVLTVSLCNVSIATNGVSTRPSDDTTVLPALPLQAKRNSMGRLLNNDLLMGNGLSVGIDLKDILT